MPDKKEKKKRETEATDSAAAADAPAALEPKPEEGEKKKEKKEKKAPPKDMPPKRTHLGDSGTIKRLMDDAAIFVLLDDDEGYKYVEDTSMSNLKLVVGFAGVGASLVSHVWPATFPKNWWVLLLCCAFYFLMSGVLQLLLSFVELESIIVLRGKPRDDGTRRPGINVSSFFPRFQEIYTLGFTPVPGSAMSLHNAPRFRPDLPGGNTEAHCLQFSWSVEKFFDEEGVFAEEDFIAVVKEAVSEYEALLETDGSKKVK